jgi:hypothetical protein
MEFIPKYKEMLHRGYFLYLCIPVVPFIVPISTTFVAFHSLFTSLFIPSLPLAPIEATLH